MDSKKDTYLSVFSPQELWGEHQIDFFRKIIALGDHGSYVGYSIQDAETNLRFFERFNPGIPHDRTVAQVVIAGVLKNPRWSGNLLKRVKLVSPDRDVSDPASILEDVIELDLGEFARQVSVSTNPPIILANDYFGVQYDTRDIGKQGLTMVTLNLLPCSYEHPVLFTISDYLAIDGQRVREKCVVHRPAFNKDTHGFVKYVHNAVSRKIC